MIDRERIFKKYTRHCWYCWIKATKISDLEVDHINPKRKWGTNDYNNLIWACRSCNRSKNSFDIEQWRKELQKNINRLNKSTTSYKISKRFWLIKETGISIKFYYEDHPLSTCH